MKFRILLFPLVIILAAGGWYYLQGQKKEPIDPLKETPPGVLGSIEGSSSSSLPVVLGTQKDGAQQLRNAGPIDGVLDSPKDNVAVTPPLANQKKQKPVISPEDYLFLEPEQPYTPRYFSLTVGGAPLNAEYAYDLRRQIKGLSGREGLDPGTGLFYAFASPGKYYFWMRGMLFPIDVIWIGSDARVVDVKENLSPDTFPEKFTSREDAQYVLEAPAGFAKSNKIKIGATVDLSKLSTVK